MKRFGVLALSYFPSRFELTVVSGITAPEEVEGPCQCPVEPAAPSSVAYPYYGDAQ
jgi:hypothetical protein